MSECHEPVAQVRYFLTYRGVKLPLCLVEELDAAAVQNRNTCFRATYDRSGRMTCVEKLVYGEVEMRHDYEYQQGGALQAVTVRVGDEQPQVLSMQTG